MRRSYFVFFTAFVAISAAAAGAWLLRVREESPLSPRNAAERLLADCQWHATVEACGALLRESPEDGEIWLWRGRGRLALGQYDAAAADFTEAIARLPREAEPRYFRAMVHERLGNRDLADADFEAARQLDPSKDKLQLALRDEAAARAVRGVVREANRVAEERSSKWRNARMAKADERVAAISEATEMALREPAGLQASPPAAGRRRAKGPEKASPSETADESAFTKLTSANLLDKRYGAMASLPAKPEDLLALPAATSAASVIEEPSDLGGNRFSIESPGRSSLGGSAESSLDGVAEPSANPHFATTPADSSAETTPPLSAWEQFQQRQTPRPDGQALPGARLGMMPFAPRGSDDSEATDSELGNDTTPMRKSKYPVRTWTALGETSQAGTLPVGPLAARAKASEPLSTAQPSPYSPRGPENALSTAMIPLPTAAIDMSAARASSPSGVLSMAIHELFSPSGAKGKPPLATYTSPLPEWISPPESALPKRR